MNIDELVKLLSFSVQKVGIDDEVDVFDFVDYNFSRDLIGLEEVFIYWYERMCLECGQMGVGFGRLFLNIDEVEFMCFCI